LKWELGIKDPQKLPREEYWQAYADFLYLRTIKRRFYKNILLEVIQESFAQRASE
jgi:hypothetical protein